MDDTKLLLLADKFRRLRDRVDGLSVKQEEIQLKEGQQGPKGEQGDRGFDGAPGKDGDDGADGTDGQDGKDGVSVVNAEISFDGSLVIYLSDGKEIDCGYVVKETGDTVIQTLKQGATVGGGGGITSITSTDGSVVVTDVAGVVDLSVKPAGTNTQVQYNNSNVFGASANFTYVSGTNTVSFGNITGSALGMTIQPLAPTSGSANTLTLRARNAAAGNFNGGDVSLVSGDSTGTGSAGSISFQSGASPSDSGALFVVSGASPGFSGGINSGAGYAATGVGGDFLFYLGGGATDDGNMYFQDSGGSSFIHCKTATPAGAQQIGFFNATPVAKPAPTASGTQSVVDSLVTSLNSLGLIDATSITNPSVITPAGANTEIQYNNSGALGASSNFTFNSTTNTVTLGATTGTATYTTRIPTTAQNPIALVVAAQNSIRTAGTSPGGALTLRSGNGRTTGAGGGGALAITSGNAGTTGVGGAINITSGNGGTTSGNGGAITILGGSATSGTGGNVTVQAGPAAAVFLTGGNNPNGNGGNITGRAGQGAGAGVANGGNFDFSGGDATGALGGDGGALFFRGGSGSGAGGNGGDNQFANGTAGTAANSDGNVLLYLTGSAGAPGSILLNSSFSTPAIEVTKNAGTSATEIGFFNAVPVGKPTAVPVTAAGIHAALVSLGLIS